MAFRYWLSGPRILGGLVRPGISFYAKDLAAKPTAADLSLIFVLTRADGAVMIGRDKTPEADSVPASDDLKMPIVFAFRSVDAADAVLAGARLRLAKAAEDDAGWLRGISAGQAAAAIKNEARGLSHEFDVIHPHLGEEPPKPANPKPYRRLRLVLYILIAVTVLLMVLIAIGQTPRAPE
jgi:hypothetical protein